MTKAAQTNGTTSSTKQPVPRKRYSPEFKQKAIDRVLAGETVYKVAKETKMSYARLRELMKDQQNKAALEASNGKNGMPKQNDNAPQESSQIATLKDQLNESLKQVQELKEYTRRLESFIVHKVVDEGAVHEIIRRSNNEGGPSKSIQ